MIGELVFGDWRGLLEPLVLGERCCIFFNKRECRSAGLSGFRAETIGLTGVSPSNSLTESSGTVDFKRLVLENVLPEFGVRSAACLQKSHCTLLLPFSSAWQVHASAVFDPLRDNLPAFEPLPSLRGLRWLSTMPNSSEISGALANDLLVRGVEG
eukprot:3705746-Rhodomonas_salina.1